MDGWSVAQLLSSLHEKVELDLRTARTNFAHPVTKGDASEGAWLSLFNSYLPERYRAEKAHVADSKGSVSDQIDVVVFDRQYTPFIFEHMGQKVIPAESVYAVFEAKQSINLDHVNYTKQKLSSVRRLHRTSLPIPHAGGTFAAKPLIHIIGGILTLESDWNPPFGSPFISALNSANPEGRIDVGCVAAHGMFAFDQKTGSYEIQPSKRAATAFLFKLISLLQFSGTVPMIDIQAYAQWLSES
jgi:hypothetical protein